MKNFLKKSLVIFAMLVSTLSIVNLTNFTPAYAESEDALKDNIVTGRDPSSSTTTNPTGPNCRYFLGMVSWDCGINEYPANDDDLATNASIVITNIATDIARIAGYLVIGYVIYGGYLYILAAGDTGKVAAGKKTLTHAFIGLAIVGLTNVIIGSVQLAFFAGSGTFENCPPLAEGGCSITPEALITNTIQWFIGIAGVIAAAFLVIGGIKYITSSGDSSKLQQAKNTILYALIGLAIVGLTEVIVAFVDNIINKADGGADIGASIVIILNNIIAVAGVIAVIFIIVGGVTYMTSAGDPGKIQKAKSTLLYSVIGLIVVALAYAIVNFAIGAISGNSSDEESSEETSLLEKPIAFLEEKL